MKSFQEARRAVAEPPPVIPKKRADGLMGTETDPEVAQGRNCSICDIAKSGPQLGTRASFAGTAQCACQGHAGRYNDRAADR